MLAWFQLFAITVVYFRSQVMPLGITIDIGTAAYKLGFNKYWI